MTERNLDVMESIMVTKEYDIQHTEQQPLDPEGIEMGKHKRFTLDMVDVSSDPLR